MCRLIHGAYADHLRRCTDKRVLELHLGLGPRADSFGIHRCSDRLSHLLQLGVYLLYHLRYLLRATYSLVPLFPPDVHLAGCFSPARLGRSGTNCLRVVGVGAHWVGCISASFPLFHTFSLTRTLVSSLGPVALATQSVLLVSCSTTYQAPFALSIASSVR